MPSPTASGIRQLVVAEVVVKHTDATQVPVLPRGSAPSSRNRILAECREQLLTPVGLRTLAPSDPRYRGRYVGGVAERDGGYHQGPAWTWLLGHYALAEYRVDGDAAAAQARLEALAGQLNEAVIGQLSELHDGDAPHWPRGAPAQAWSVACTLEAWWRLQLARGSGATADPQVEEGA